MANEVPELPRLRYAAGVTVPEALPQKLGPFRLHRRLGVGGMAETFVASREDASGLVCVKKVLPAFARDRAFVEQFQREAAVAGQLRHPNVVELVDFGAHEGELFMAMELVEGIDLAELLQAEPHRRLPTDVAALVIHDLALGLGHAHSAAIVHRDVTPSNVLLGRDGRVKLADFGVAKALTSTTAATATGFLKGKVPYMAPEYIQGQGVSPKIDLFSLGVVLYEALAGTRPFVGTNDVEVMMRLMTTRAAPLVGVPEDLAELAARMLDRDPTSRPETAEEVASLLTTHFDVFESRARLVERIAKVVRAPFVAETWTKDDLPAVGPSPTPSTAVMNPLGVALPDRTALDLRTPFAEVAPDSTSVESPAARPLRVLAAALGLLLGGAVVGVVATQSSPSSESANVSSPPDDEAETAQVSPSEQAHPNTHPDDPLGATDIPEGVEAPEPLSARENTAPDDASDDAPDDAPARATSMTTRARSRRVTMEAPSPAPQVATPVPEVAPPTPREVEPVDQGTVEVTVVPWGFVWIDGRRVGRSPVRTTVPAGTHSIRAGFEGPTTPVQRVEVPRGATRRLELVIED